MKFKPRTKMALYVAVITIMLAVSNLEKAFLALGGRQRPIIIQEASRQIIEATNENSSLSLVAKIGNGSGILFKGEHVSEERQQMKNLVHFLASAPPGKRKFLRHEDSSWTCHPGIAASFPWYYTVSHIYTIPSPSTSVEHSSCSRE